MKTPKPEFKNCVEIGSECWLDFTLIGHKEWVGAPSGTVVSINGWTRYIPCLGVGCLTIFNVGCL